ncbi:MAG: type II toxin-antitoxin system HicA family toxin [Rhodospirillales bacterium]|nr:type II toxin-antitoxin system HicA family toxin [Rhodospirillales bacterium]
MNGNEFLKRVKRYAKHNGLDVRFEKHRGKGSHGTLYLGGKKTTVQDRKKELPSGTLRAMLAQLGIQPGDF